MAIISGAHAIIYSRDADADRAFLREIVGLPSVDVGHGWLIFALPPSEVAVHPADSSESHELYFMVDDVNAFVRRMQDNGVRCTKPQDRGWGVLTNVSLPGGGTIGIYEPRHARPSWPARAKPRPARRGTRGAARRSSRSR